MSYIYYSHFIITYYFEVIIIKKKIILITLLFSLFIVSSLIGILFIKDVKGITQDIDYEFTSDDLSITNERTFNIKDQSNYTGHYNSTYSFENDIIGYKPNDWYGYGSIIIINEFNYHNEVLLLDGNDIESIYLKNNFTVQDIGTIEFWISTNNTYKTFYFLVYQEPITAIFLTIRLNKLEIAYGFTHKYISINNNTWYHIRIDFNCTSNKHSYWINNVLELDNQNFYENEIIDSLNLIQLYLSNSEKVYIDAIGYSWNNYTIGQNLVPYLEINPNIQEVDKCEFAYNENTGVINTEGSSNTNGWTDIDDGNDEIQVMHSAGDWSDCYVSYDIWYNDYYGITKDFSQIDGIFNIIMRIDYLEFFYISGGGLLDWNIHSYDDTLIVNIRILEVSTTIYKIHYYNGSDYIFLYELNDVGFQDLHLNLYISSFCILRIQDYDIKNTYMFEKIDSSKKGLNKVEFKGKNGGGSYLTCQLESLGVYVNGSSYLPNDLSAIKYDVVETWKSIRHNIIDINGNGIFNLIVFDGSLDYTIFDFTEFNGIKQRFLYYDDEFDGNDMFMLFVIKVIPIDISEISIKGVCLKESINKYYLIFSHNGINHNISYFYVDNNRLYFNHIANENDVLEYIQAKFIIDNVYAINGSINFNTYFYGISKAYFKTNYVSNTNSTFPFRLGSETFNTILPQQQIIKSFTILITDNNNNDYYGNSEGYISSITLIYYLDIELTILTLSLIEIMIPLIILLIPTIAISSIYGKKAIIPMLILMSFICFITNLIQPEMFFIMMLCLGCALFLQYKREKEKV